MGYNRTIVNQFLSANGDGTGNTELTGAGYTTGSPGILNIQPPNGVCYVIQRMIVTLEDSTGMSAAEYGNIGSALTNGVLVRYQQKGVVRDLTPLPITTNAYWGSYCYDADVKTWGVGNDILLARWTFARSGEDVELWGSDSDYLEVVGQDDLSGLVVQRFLVQGYAISEKVKALG